MSQNSKITSELNGQKIKHDLNKDIRFFDLEYFRTRGKALLDVYYSGKGQVGYMHLLNGETFGYSSLMDHIVKRIDKHSAQLYRKGAEPQTFKDGADVQRSGLGWFVGLYIDACHSGSALGAGVRWANKQDGRFRTYEERDDETLQECKVDYFSTKCYLELMVMASCATDESANVSTNNKASSWTKNFLLKGRQPVPSDAN